MTYMGQLRSAAAVCAMALLSAPTAQASAPQLKTQAPGYYRMMLGDFEITALSDGTFPMKPGELLVGITPNQIDADLARSFLKNPVETSVNGFLINTGTKLILIDTGAGAFYGPTVGKLAANLKASGYQPEQVDEIYVTHMHLDHVGGLIADGKRVFPNATVRAAQQEADYWLSQSKMDAAPKEAKEGFEHAMTALHPYVSAGKFKPFNGAVELVPGIRAVPTPGHTPGHTVYEVSSKGETLLLWGDLMHLGAIQFPDPSVTLRFDSDTSAAAAQRKKIFAEAAEHGYWVGGAHLPFPGIGHLRATSTGNTSSSASTVSAGTPAASYTYVHANYTSLASGQ